MFMHFGENWTEMLESALLIKKTSQSLELDGSIL